MNPFRDADLFISDLHLQAEQPEVRALFESFLERYASGARSLTINGDFLNAYAGFRQLSLPYWSELAERMRELAAGGLTINFVSGNRDFMLVRDARRMGMIGFKEHAIIEHDHQAIGVIHGDIFCLDDASYLRFRKVIRAIPLHWINILTPARFGQWVTRKLRKKSMQKMADVSQRELPSYWDIKDRAVVPFAESNQLDVVICGHIHQPQERIYVDRESGAERFRLLIKGDWKAESAIIAAAIPGQRVELFELTPESCELWKHEVQRVDVPLTSE